MDRLTIFHCHKSDVSVLNATAGPRCCVQPVSQLFTMVDLSRFSALPNSKGYKKDFTSQAIVTVGPRTNANIKQYTATLETARSRVQEDQGREKYKQMGHNRFPSGLLIAENRKRRCSCDLAVRVCYTVVSSTLTILTISSYSTLLAHISSSRLINFQLVQDNPPQKCISRLDGMNVICSSDITLPYEFIYEEYRISFDNGAKISSYTPTTSCSDPLTPTTCLPCVMNYYHYVAYYIHSLVDDTLDDSDASPAKRAWRSRESARARNISNQEAEDEEEHGKVAARNASHNKIAISTLLISFALLQRVELITF
ncbi:hypothetical protein J6590_005826 [Homalodisca vitripennis]|nr:hypothetical protein J6590_005826 [Homalodisca vitripennis]